MVFALMEESGDFQSTALNKPATSLPQKENIFYTVFGKK